ncbi:MAG TPA: glycoside hydrolase family 2 TIM barrel-domain containing protein [Tepidisphaeraceae bacterium]|nr:glycoside hydrolase family 2 TIM barrel-domain containing protein [Tepidisphaeraceae bacterium]
MFLLTALCTAAASAQATLAGVKLAEDKLTPGTTIDLTGQWLFKPTYALDDGEKPESSTEPSGYHPAPVPQMLSRIQWWLDDSEDFKKWEQERLDKLGFDTEKSDDGWYRLDIEVPQLPKGRHLWIEFDGVAMRSRTFINGHELGQHAGMFSRFSYDLTPHLKPGRNTLAMWVSMEKIPPTSGNLGEAVTVNLSAAKVISMSKGMFGPLTPNQDNRAYDLYGIWQPVKLVVRGPNRIDDVWFQPTVSGADIQITLRQPAGTYKVTLTDLKTNEKLAEQVGGIASAASATDLVNVHFEALKPKLWTPAEPNLYRLEVTLDEQPDGSYSDRWIHNVGFRTFEVKGNQLYLNGKRYWMRGANQLPYGKNPWDPQLPRKLIQMLHDANIDSTRTHCTPWNEAWLDAADEIGLAVSIEGIRPWAFAGRSDQIGHEVMPPSEIVQHWLMENADVVKRCRNHPSVFIFTVGNEMLLRDKENLKKWQILSDVAKQTKQLAPNHPIVVSSDYVREEKFYETTLKPAGMYDGDVDDMHKYSGWYADSPFVVDTSSYRANPDRPLIGQEMSSGYPDLDTGLPVLRYTRDLVTPQAWVGVYAYPGNDPAIFLAEHAEVTKRWAEQLRFERGDKTAGFSLFSAECWFRHSYLPEATPYPVLEAVKDAFAPVGLALETHQRRFFAGDTIETSVYITNDDEQGRDLKDLRLIATIGRESSVSQELANVAQLPYYATKKFPVTLKLPAGREARRRTELILMLKTRDGQHVSGTTDPIEIFPGPTDEQRPSDGVIVVNADESLDGLKEGGDLRQQIESGATAIVFSPSKEILKLFPDDLLDIRGTPEKPDFAEFADWYPARGTKLAENLQPMDIKWWARKNDWRAYVAGTSHRLKPGARARELIRYIPAHSYIPAEKVPDQYRVVMSEIPLGRGRLWICDLDLAASAEIDPAARLVRDNLYRAAADPESTKNLQPVPPHEVLLKGTQPIDANPALPPLPVQPTKAN